MASGRASSAVPSAARPATLSALYIAALLFDCVVDLAFGQPVEYGKNALYAAIAPAMFVVTAGWRRR